MPPKASGGGKGEAVKSKSPAEFFAENQQIAGFDNVSVCFRGVCVCVCAGGGAGGGLVGSFMYVCVCGGVSVCINGGWCVYGVCGSCAASS